MSDPAPPGAVPVPPAAPALAYRPEVDGLRALAVVPVILFHAGVAGLSGGYVGVDVFFVISGFLITSIIVAERRAGTFSLAGFYERRMRRILPALFVVMLACLPFAWLWMIPRQVGQFAPSLAAVALFASNLLFWKTSGYFDDGAELEPLLHTWSLGVEEQYYLLFPLVVLACWRFGRRALVALVAGVALASWALSVWASHAHGLANFFLAPTRAWELLAGALLALAAIDRPPGLGAAPAWRQALSLAGLALVFDAMLTFDAATPVPGVPALVPTIGTVLLLAFATRDTWVGRLLAHPWLVGLGLVSYGAYLWHQPLFAFARIARVEPPGVPLLAGLALAAFALAWVSWRVVERPFRDRTRVGRRAVYAWSAGGSALFVALGLAGHGLADRLPATHGDVRISSGWTPSLHDCAFPTRGFEHTLCGEQVRVHRTAAGERRILFVGDSLLMAMTGGLQAASQRAGVPINITARWDCPSLAGLTRVGPADTAALCAEHNRNWVAFVRRHAITDVVLVSAFDRYFRRGGTAQVDARGEAGANRNGDARVDHAPDPRVAAPADAFGKALVDTIDALTRQGVRVTVMRQLPDFGLVLHGEVNKAVWRSPLPVDPAAFSMPRALHDADAARFDALVRGRAEVIDAAALFCDAMRCSPIHDGQVMYVNNDHPGVEGDRYLAGYWTQFLQQRFGPQG